MKDMFNDVPSATASACRAMQIRSLGPHHGPDRHASSRIRSGAPDRPVSFHRRRQFRRDIFAGYACTEEDGAADERLVIATNDNDILARTWPPAIRAGVKIRPPRRRWTSGFTPFRAAAVRSFQDAVRRWCGTCGGRTRQSGAFTIRACRVSPRSARSSTPTVRPLRNSGDSSALSKAAICSRSHTATGALRCREPCRRDVLCDEITVLGAAHPAKFPPAVGCAAIFSGPYA